ncbi:hypothetical protein DEA8626_00573 [Defluviimonas aquaemixtae]|uniref:Uncharacterized protein n=1 Tax=Albidovulum aquaemixtae TaxID=1542388 RepID=A0A2R8B323_9RHOB|nr:hypothetical protein [Defluviimonas aquaemixtae]SPH17059.1 hypothetical protein DEA8626_00573 [Defluviimonas aquaemixtae]
MPRYASFLLPVALTACTAIFRDDFEADPAGSAPLANPAGAPADSLTFAEGPGAVSVTTALPLEGEQSLRIDGPSSRTAPRVIMYAAPIFDQTKPVFLSWSGRMGSGAQVEINIWVDFDKFPLRLNFEQGLVYANGNSIGSYSGTGEHAVFVSLNPVTDQWGVSLSGAADSGGGVAGAFPDADDFPGSHVGIAVQLLNATGPTGYWMDDVRISHWQG